MEKALLSNPVNLIKVAFCLTTSLLLCHPIFSQRVSGRIVNALGEKIPLATVITKDSLASGIIKEFAIARNGEYIISLRATYERIVIVVAANGYLKESFELEKPSADSLYIHDFLLQKDDSKQLPEVTVTAKIRPFQVRGDTVKFNVGSYRDGSERKIEDLLKKLPGIEVNEATGQITYKGKTVETVKLEGDDLFGSNYTIGTRNINVDIVEQVQAIENYHDNTLLKGVENDGKVALNLKLRKNKVDFSGDADLGSGVSKEGKAVHDADANMLRISSNYKAFATASYNNIGTNNSPFDYFSYHPNADQLTDMNFLAKKNIPETIIQSELEDKRANLNNAIFANYNQIFKIKNRLAIKSNLYYLRDEITLVERIDNNNFIGGQPILTTDNYHLEKRPLQYRGDVQVKYNTSEKSLLEYTFKASREQIHTPATVEQTDSLRYQTLLNSKDVFIKNSIIFTQQVSAKKVMQLLVNATSDDIPQHFVISPSLYNPAAYAADDQSSHFKKNIATAQCLFLGSTAKTKYTVSIGSAVEQNRFQSALTGKETLSATIIDGFGNSFWLKKSTIYNSAEVSFLLRRWRLSLSYTLSSLRQALFDKLSGEKPKRSDNILEPAFSVRRKLSATSAISGTFNYFERPSSEEYFFSHPIYTSNRATVENIPELQLLKTTSYAVFYLVNNLYRQFQLQFGVNYVKNLGGYFANSYIQQNSTRLIYFYLGRPNENTNINFLIEKYVPAFGGTIRLKSNYALSNYKDIVNNSDLRDNESHFLSTELFFKTAFKISVNFESVARYRLQRSKSESDLPFTNSAFNNTFKILIRPGKKWFILLSSDFFLPNTKSASSYLFLDASLRYSPKHKKFDVSFVARNILNEKNFIQIETTDFSTSIFQSNLIPAYFMCRVSYNF